MKTPPVGHLKTGSPALILASSSKARQQLLARAGLKFKVVKAEIDERALELEAQKNKMPLSGISLLLARQKALNVAGFHPDSLIIGADQILELNGTSLNKPNDLQEARQQLLALRGTIHYLHSSVVLVRKNKILFQHVSTANLTMRNFSENELDRTMKLEGDSIVDSVGSYHLEGPGINLFSEIKGDYFAILGLPMLELLAALRQYQTSE